MAQPQLAGPGVTSGKVRWRRFAAIMVPGLLATGAVVSLCAQGALAASFALAGQSAKLSAAHLEGKGFMQFSGLDTNAADGSKRPVLVSGFKEATLSDLCQSVVIPTPVGKISVILRAGGGGTPVAATNLVSDLDQLTGTIQFNGYESGLSASAVTKGPLTGQAGMWAQQADSISIDNLRQTAWATNAGSFKLVGLSLKTSFSTEECY